MDRLVLAHPGLGIPCGTPLNLPLERGGEKGSRVPLRWSEGEVWWLVGVESVFGW